MLFSKQLPSDSATARTAVARRSLTVPAKAADPSALRIATYNIHKGVSAWSWRSRIHELRESLHQLDADVVFLQEVQGKSDKHAQRFKNWPDAAQHDFIASSVWDHAVYGRNAERADGHHGNAFLSRYALVKSENLDVSDHRFESRGLLHCEIQVGERIVHCLCAHFGLFEDSRRRQADALIARIRNTVPDDAPLIIAGDFNDWRNRLGAQLAEGLGVTEAFEMYAGADRTLPVDGAGLRAGVRDLLVMRRRRAAPAPARTYPAVFPMFRLDRVYLRGFAVREAVVMAGEGWRRLSDHAPIVADLKFV
jgi:endonuclease/exonuclease/phosphatase family metal-dependent hydrolase